MENVQENYRGLLNRYSVASQYFQETGDASFLSTTLAMLESFERLFLEVYSFEEFLDLREKLSVDESKLLQVQGVN